MSPKEKVRYYEGRVIFLQSLLTGHLSGKQRAQAQRELMQANVKRLMAENALARSATRVSG